MVKSAVFEGIWGCFDGKNISLLYKFLGNYPFKYNKQFYI